MFELSPRPDLIEMTDGSLILVSSGRDKYGILVEIDSKGNQEITKTEGIGVELISITRPEAQSGYRLYGFSGRAKTKSGEMGDFWIDRSEVQSIEFEGP